MKLEPDMQTDLRGAIRLLDMVLHDAQMDWRARHMRMQTAWGMIEMIAWDYERTMLRRETEPNT